MNDQNKIFFQGVRDDSIDQDKARAKVLAHLISMPIELKDLRVYQFEWLLHVVQYVSNAFISSSKIQLYLLQLI